MFYRCVWRQLNAVTLREPNARDGTHLEAIFIFGIVDIAVLAHLAHAPIGGRVDFVFFSRLHTHTIFQTCFVLYWGKNPYNMRSHSIFVFSICSAASSSPEFSF